MKILLTGGCGYVGRRLFPALLDAGYEVTVVDPCIFGPLRHDDPGVSHDSFMFERLRIEEAPDWLFKDIDAVVHLAGLSNDPMAHFSPLGNFVMNAAVAVHTAYRAKLAGVKRFVLASSASIYQGITKAVKAVPQNLHVSPYEPYAVSKLMAEYGCLGMGSDGMSVGILRKGTIGGWSPRMRYDLMFNTMFKDAMQKDEIVVYVRQDGSTVMRPHLDIADAVNAYIWAISDRRTRAWNIASANVSVMEAARAVQAVTGAGIQTAFADFPLRNYVMGRITFDPCRSIEDMLREMKQLAPRDFDNDQYYNIKVWKDFIKSGGDYWSFRSTRAFPVPSSSGSMAA